MKLRYVVLPSILLLAEPLSGQAKPSGARVHWNCAATLLPEVRFADAKEANQGEAISYLYIGAKDLHQDYAAQATFVSPIDVKRELAPVFRTRNRHPLCDDFASYAAFLVD